MEWKERYSFINKKAGELPALLTHVLHLRTKSAYHRIVFLHVTSSGDKGTGSRLASGMVMWNRRPVRAAADSSSFYGVYKTTLKPGKRVCRFLANLITTLSNGR